MRKVRFVNSNRNYLDGTIFDAEKNGGERRRGVICLHGFGRHGDEPKFHELGRELSRRGVTTLSFSMSGWGQSEGDCYRMTMDGLASDVRSAAEFLRKEAKVERLNVFAHSMGACVVAKSMFTYGKMFERIVFLAPALNQKKLQRYWFAKQQFRDATWSDFRHHLDEDMFRKYISEPRVVKDLSGNERKVSANFFLHVSMVDYTTLIGGRSDMILHIHGTHDKTVPMECVKLPGCKNISVKMGDHDLENMCGSWTSSAADYLVLNGNGFCHS